MSELVPVPFLDGEVLAIEQDGKQWVVFRPIVEDLGLSYSPQLRKLRAASWSCVLIMSTQLPDQQQSRATVMVEIGSLAMWLAGVEESRVAAAIRPRLSEYQTKIKKVIEQYFAGQRPQVDLQELPMNFEEAVGQLFIALKERRLAEEANVILFQRNDELEERIEEVAADAAAWNLIANAEGPMTFAEAAQMLSNDPAINLGQNRLVKLLQDKKLEWLRPPPPRNSKRKHLRAFQPPINAGYLKLEPGGVFVNGRGELELAPPQIRVTPKGLVYLYRFLKNPPVSNVRSIES